MAAQKQLQAIHPETATENPNKSETTFPTFHGLYTSEFALGIIARSTSARNIPRTAFNRNGHTNIVMDSKGIFCVYVLGALWFLGARAAEPCGQEYKQCLEAMMPIIQALGSSVQQDPDGNVTSTMERIFATLCSPKGIEAMKCMMGVMKRCPALMAGAGGAGGASGGSMLPGFNFTEIEMQGGMENACEMLKGKCKQLLPCILAIEEDRKMSPGGGEPGVIATPYSMLPMRLESICGPGWGSLKCLDRYEKDCPNVVEKFTQQAQQAAAGDPSGIGYDRMVTFMRQNCHAMPADHQCEDQALASDDFVACYTNMSTKYNISQEATLSCKVYDDNKNCIDTHVKPACGKASANLLKAASGMVVKGMPPVAECEPQVGGAGFLQASGTLVLIASIFQLGRL